MKVGSRCGYCLAHRGYYEIVRGTADEARRFDAVRQLLALLGGGFDPDAVPARLGSERDRLIRGVTGCADPYVDLKRRADEEALKMLPQLEALIDAQPAGGRLRTACMAACVGNVIEYDVPDHDPDVGRILEEVGKGVFYINDMEPFEALLKGGIDVLLIADNAGEVAFDRLVVRELRALGSRVTVSVKGGPALNDATMDDARAVGLVDDADAVITTGTDAIGVNLEESSEEFKAAFYSSQAIVSKGMANWETLTEYPAPCPTLFLFRTKCEPVAAAVGAPLERNIAKLVPMGWRL
jgi:hypothetical protein